jgi:ribosome maturation factor RimP
VAVELIGGRRRPILRLSIDKPGGVGADDCALASVRLGPVFDASDPMSTAYELELSSPGIERPVQRFEDFQRFVGFRARIRMEEGLPRRRYTGRLLRVEGDDVIVEADGAEHVLAFASIDSAHLVLDLDEYQQLADGAPPVPTDADASSDEPSSDQESP